MCICIIPARGGSKRIPRKNIRYFSGKPMIAWSIEVARSSNLFSRIIVSTDDLEIASMAHTYGAEVPFIRPSTLSEDLTSTKDVIVHCLKTLDNVTADDDPICCLYATAPFVTASDLRNSICLLKTSKPLTTIFPATTYSYPIQRALMIDDNGYSSCINKAYLNSRSQDLETLYHDAGQFYLALKKTWLSDHFIFDSGRPLIIPRWRVQDIDTEEDWKCAELMHSAISTSI